MDFTEEQQIFIDTQMAEAKGKWVAEELVQLELWNKEKTLHIKEKGLSDFAEFFNGNSIEDLDIGISKFNSIMEAKKLNNSYIPEGHKQTDAYAQAEKKGDTQSMIGNKLSKLFK